MNKFLHRVDVSQEKVSEYVKVHGGIQNDALDEIAKITQTHPYAMMMVGFEVSRLIQLQMKLLNAKKCIEVGVFTGYNTASMALALPSDGKVVALDISDEFVKLGRPVWEKHGLSDKIDVMIGKATDSLQLLVDRGESGTFDFVFIDADKANYDNYYEKALDLLRPGGMIGIDNALWGYRVCQDESDHSKDTSVIHALNKKINSDDRVHSVLLDLTDGFNLCLKK